MKMGMTSGGFNKDGFNKNGKKDKKNIINGDIT